VKVSALRDEAPAGDGNRQGQGNAVHSLAIACASAHSSSHRPTAEKAHRGSHSRCLTATAELIAIKALFR